MELAVKRISLYASATLIVSQKGMFSNVFLPLPLTIKVMLSVAFS